MVDAVRLRWRRRDSRTRLPIPENPLAPFLHMLDDDDDDDAAVVIHTFAFCLLFEGKNYLFIVELFLIKR